MLLTIGSTMPQARDLGFLLHKHPDRVQTFEVPQGTATVFFPDASDEYCEVALLLDVDRDQVAAAWRGRGEALSAYVNDRPYASGSLLGTAAGKVFRSALIGRCDARPELVAAAHPFTVHIPALRVKGGAPAVWRLFDALGYRVEVEPLDLAGLSSGSPVVSLSLEGTVTLQELLSHLTVILPALDAGALHYVQEEDAVRLARLAPWLATHPARDMLLRRSLAGQRDLISRAAAELGAPPPAPRVSLADTRMEAVHSALKTFGVRTVADLGCGEGVLLERLAQDPSFTRIVGADVVSRVLSRAAKRLEHLSEHQRRRVRLVQSSALLPDSRVMGEAAVLVEVVEHLDPWRLSELEAAVFPRFDTVVVTTPNVEYNVLLGDGMRHTDHRFEWSRAEAAAWAARVASAHGMTFECVPVGEVHPQLGPPTQMVLFRRSK